jgi:hypothetical protein
MWRLDLVGMLMPVTTAAVTMQLMTTTFHSHCWQLLLLLQLVTVSWFTVKLALPVEKFTVTSC